jgi:formamidopyrimidine-DNA glycosylase
MPELPEVETTLRGVSPYLVGQRIQEVIIRNASLRWPVPDSLHDMTGQQVSSARRRGKYMLFETPVGTLLLHLGMSGSLRVSEPDTPWKKHDHLALTTTAGKQIRLHDPRRFGAALWLLPAEVETHPLLAKLGPEPLGQDFHPGYLQATCKGRQAPIKAVIMDSQVVVGIGNIYACEALFMAGIHPQQPAGQVKAPQLRALVSAIQEVLTASIEMGGTTLRDFLNERGEPGYFKQTLRVYARPDQPCLRPACPGQIQRLVMSQRSTFFCPQCQQNRMS